MTSQPLTQVVAIFNLILQQCLPGEYECLIMSLLKSSKLNYHSDLNQFALDTAAFLFQRVMYHNEQYLVKPLSTALRTYLAINNVEISAFENHLVRLVNRLIFNHNTVSPRSSLNPDICTWVFDIFIPFSQCCTIDNLPPQFICLIGIIACVDQSIKKLLVRRTSRSFFDETFRMAAIIKNFRKIEQPMQGMFFDFLVHLGSEEMLEQIMKAGIEPSSFRYSEPEAILRSAIRSGSVKKIDLLISSGGKGVPHLGMLTWVSHQLDSDVRYQRILDFLVMGTKRRVPPSIVSFREDPLLQLYQQRWHSVKHPRCQLVEVILSQGNYQPQRLLGTASSKPCINGPHLFQSYIYWTILAKDAGALNLLLKCGVDVDSRIDQLFDCSSPLTNFFPMAHFVYKYCTWLGFALHVGSSSCASVLIQHGASVVRTDGYGKSAVRIVKSNFLSPHPRRYWEKESRWWFDQMTGLVSCEEDGESLAVVKEAFEHHFPNCESFDDYEDPSIRDKVSAKELLLQGPEKCRDKVTDLFQDPFAKFLNLFYRDGQGLMSRSLHRCLHDLWHSSSFFDLLLMRFLYMVSYTLLLCISLQNLATSIVSLPRPSRTVLFAVIFLMLALSRTRSFLGSD